MSEQNSICSSKVICDQKNAKGGQAMRCRVCNWVYDPAQGEPNQGVMPGTPWEEVPETFLCPECFLGKSEFDPA